MTPITNRFTSFEFTEEEERLGIHLDSLQVAIIQNEIAIYATEKSDLKFEPNDPLSFAQAEAELKGKILALEYLLALNSEV